MLYTIIYISRATDCVSEESLQDILKASRHNNPSTGVSGMLLYKDGEFMQALEGEQEAVLKLMNRIAGDPRHSDILTLSKSYTTQVFQKLEHGIRKYFRPKKTRSIRRTKFF